MMRMRISRKKRVTNRPSSLAPEVRAALIDLLAEMLVDEIHANPAVQRSTVAEPTLCNQNSILEKEV